MTARLDFHFHGMEDDVCFGQFDVFSLDYGHSAKSVNGGDWVEACRIRIVKEEMKNSQSCRKLIAFKGVNMDRGSWWPPEPPICPICSPYTLS